MIVESRSQSLGEGLPTELPQQSPLEGSDLPGVTLVVPMRNEKGYIRDCLQSLVESDYPPDRLEILVLDGQSTDGSLEIVGEFAAKGYPVRIVNNPDRTSASGVNLGLRMAQHEIVIRIDAHSVYECDYVRQSVTLLLTVPGAGGVAGVQRAAGKGYLQGAIAASMAHPFASGFAKYRRTTKPCWVDTVYLGAWRRDVALGIGGFDTDWQINADYEFNIRLRQTGMGLYLSPDIKSIYYPRKTLRALCRQYYRYGFWRVRTMYAHPHSWQWRQLVPPTFVALFLGLAVAAPVNVWPVMILAGLYLGAAAVASLETAKESKWAYLPILPVVFACMQIPWAVGFLLGLIRWAPQRGSLREKKRQTVSSRVLELPNSSGTS